MSQKSAEKEKWEGGAPPSDSLTSSAEERIVPGLSVQLGLKGGVLFQNLCAVGRPLGIQPGGKLGIGHRQNLSA